MSPRDAIRHVTLCMAWSIGLGATHAAALEAAPEPRELMRSGVGDWCYAPVGAVSLTQRQDFVDEIVESGKRAQVAYGVPGAILAAMAIQESGYGRTRLAILSNNLLSFKKPRSPAWQFNRPRFVLWCQPVSDVGNEYISFGSKSAAFDYVAKVLSLRPDLPYAAVTRLYREARARGVDRRIAGRAWLDEIAVSYTADPSYVRSVLAYAANPISPGAAAPPSTSLWERIP